MDGCPGYQENDFLDHFVLDLVVHPSVGGVWGLVGAGQYLGYEGGGSDVGAAMGQRLGCEGGNSVPGCSLDDLHCLAAQHVLVDAHPYRRVQAGLGLQLSPHRLLFYLQNVSITLNLLVQLLAQYLLLYLCIKVNTDPFELKKHLLPQSTHVFVVKRLIFTLWSFKIYAICVVLSEQ